MAEQTIPSAYLKSKALQVGFDACGIAQATELPQELFSVDAWVAQGKHAGMRYMEQHLDKRRDPRLLYPGARSVVSVLLGYKPSRLQEGPDKVAQYAYGADYHDLIKQRLFALIAAIRVDYPDFKARPFVDTAPISDKLWAWQAGLGWIGKHTLLVNPELGSYCNIGELVTEFAVDRYDLPLDNRCGGCTLCRDACPNGALEGCGQSILNANRCTAYYTIESHVDRSPADIDTQGYVFGCDCCQLKCPYNRSASPRREVSVERISQLDALVTTDDASYNDWVRGSAMSRVSRQHLATFAHSSSNQ